eukprot:5181674-Amphidinium_carterae.1
MPELTAATIKSATLIADGDVALSGLNRDHLRWSSPTSNLLVRGREVDVDRIIDPQVLELDGGS